mmetsp:Transcript_14395/g.17113  ORF Transcript_14395/g.17113 Transcript_14395/m.17113 type:complete len:189 (+) Transcript_14395:48-614(+)
MSSEKPFTKQLLSAAANQDLAGVNAVLQSGRTAFDINASNKSGYSALHFAADNDSVSIVKKLVKVEGINLNAKGGHFENTALHMAAFKGHTKTVKVLVANSKVDFTVVNKFGQTALDTAVSQNQAECAQMIRDKSGVGAADPNAPKEGETDMFSDPLGTLLSIPTDSFEYIMSGLGFTESDPPPGSKV